MKIPKAASTLFTKIKYQLMRNNHSERSKPIYSSVTCDGMKLHLGSGGINLQGWVNIDARMFDHTHLVTNTLDLKEFSENSISQIYMCHILEHFSFSDVHRVLAKLRTKLRQGGLLRISVPSFDSIVQIYNNNNFDIDLVKFAIMGGQEYEHNFHKSIFNKKSLTNLLDKHGFFNVEEWSTLEDFGVELGDWSSKALDGDKTNIPISLNLKAQKR